MRIMTTNIRIFVIQLKKSVLSYRNDPEFSGKNVWANNVDRVYTVLPFHLHLLHTLLYGKIIMFNF